MPYLFSVLLLLAHKVKDSQSRKVKVTVFTVSYLFKEELPTSKTIIDFVPYTVVHDDPNTPPGVLNFTQIGEIPPNTKRGLSFTDVPSAKSYQRENLPAGSTVTCGNNVLTQLDVTGAIEALKTQCGPDNNMALVKKNSHLYAQNNHVAAYFCNFKKNTDAHCGSADVDDAMTKIQKECNTRNQGKSFSLQLFEWMLIENYQKEFSRQATLELLEAGMMATDMMCGRKHFVKTEISERFQRM